MPLFQQGAQKNLSVFTELGDRINWHNEQGPWLRMLADSPAKWSLLQKGFMENGWQDPK